MQVDFDDFVKALIQAGSWQLRFSPQRFPYAFLPNGFGQGEQGVKLHFTHLGGSVKVTGVIEYSHLIRVKRPSVMISLYCTPENAVRHIQDRLIPEYKTAWDAAQPKIREYFKLQDEKEQLMEELYRTLRFTRSFDQERGVDVLTAKDVEAILNGDLTVSLKITVPQELGVSILRLISSSVERHNGAVECPACCSQGYVEGHPCALCKTQGYVSQQAAAVYRKWKGS